MPYDGNGFSCVNGKRDVLQHLRFFIAVGKTDVFEFDLTAYLIVAKSARIDFVLFINDAKQAVTRGNATLQNSSNIRDASQRL